jgi:hypothetical protein
MGDLMAVLGIVGFFGLAGLLVKACDHIIGSEESAVSAADQAAEKQEVAA